MNLDRTTIRNLEILNNIGDRSKRGTLLSVLDKTKTPMGTRLLKQWIVQPLLQKEEIDLRLDDVSVFYSDILFREEARTLLQSIYDVERLISKIDALSINPKDLIALKDSLDSIRAVQDLTESALTESGIAKRSVFKRLQDARISTHSIEQIEKAISDDPPVILSQGGVIREGFNSSLDELRYVSHNAKQWIADLEAQEREKTGIKSLKIRYNKIFGYFIEVTKSNVEKVPNHYVRRQTQVNSERYVTDELKEKENMILNADDKIKALEQDIFNALVEDIAEDLSGLQHIAQVVAEFDVLSTFAYLSYTNNYTRPQITETYGFSLQESRHPVVEQSVPDYVPNTIEFNNTEYLFVITGPNMSGKSTIMRQVALITLLAQIGCYVPAKEATVGVIDRIFTRIGASDNLFMGKSTFSVEMAETANILHNATKNSLVILDEVGRGTSTYDGLSIAWAVVEYIHDVIGAKTLFATHYHQLNRLEEHYDGIVNYNVLVKETENGIRFLHKLTRGGTDKSYGIHVARLSGIPSDVVERSKSIMTQFEINDEVGERIHKNMRNEEQVYRTVPAKEKKKSVEPDKQETLQSMFHNP
jgi:DNA mismatch repair protein MutS